MRLPRVLLLVSAAAGVFSVLATLVSESRAALQSGAVALAALTGYVLLAGPATAPRVRSALAAGIGLFAAVLAVKLWWLPERVDVGWMEPFYAPLDGSGGSRTARFPAAPALLDQARRTIDQERMVAVGLLLGVLCLAVAVRALPVRREPRRGMLARSVAVLLLVVVGADLWRRVDDETPLLGMLGAGLPALLATLLAAAMVALSGERSDRAALVPIGALLVAVTAAGSFADLAGAWSDWWTLSDRRDDAFLSVGIAVSVDGWADGSEAVRAALALAGPALLAIGARRAARDAEPA